MEISKKTFSEIEQKYDLEIPKIVRTIKKEKAKHVLLQFPDGLKPYSTAIAKEIENNLGKEKTEIIIWFGTCYGACDIPMHTEKLGIDLIIQFGHSEWKFEKN
tara:strand:+ start:148 stop:456 length:309 start_codon:yes stop_codon:yes gene_type:complete